MIGFFGLSKLAAFIPGGQIIAILGTIGEVVGKVVAAVLDSIATVFLHPIVLICVGIAFGGGFYVGVKWNESEIEAVNAKIAGIHKQWQASNERNAADIADALLARQKAEDLARNIEKANREASIRAARAGDADRLRKPSPTPSPAAPAGAQGWGVPGLSTLYGKN